MTDEFKKISSREETRYVLESGTTGGTTTGGLGGSIAKPMGGIQRRQGDNLLTPESDQEKVKQKPRQGPLRTQTGGGKHKDKTKTIPRKDKYKRALAELAMTPGNEKVAKAVHQLTQKWPGLSPEQAIYAELGLQMDTNDQQAQQISQLVQRVSSTDDALREKEKRFQDINDRLERGEITQDQADEERRQIEKEYPGAERQTEPAVKKSDKTKSQKEPEKTIEPRTQNNKSVEMPKNIRNVQTADPIGQETNMVQPTDQSDIKTNTTPASNPVQTITTPVRKDNIDAFKQIVQNIPTQPDQEKDANFQAQAVIDKVKKDSAKDKSQKLAKAWLEETKDKIIESAKASGEQIRQIIGDFLSHPEKGNSLVLDFGPEGKKVLSRVTVNKMVSIVNKHPAFKQHFIDFILPNKPQLDAFLNNILVPKQPLMRNNATQPTNTRSASSPINAIQENDSYLGDLSSKLAEVLDTTESYQKKTAGEKLAKRVEKHRKDAETDAEFQRRQQALRGIGDRMKAKSISEEMNKEHGSPYDCGGADKWYGRRYNPHKVDWTTGKDIPCETPEEQAEYAAGYRDSDTDDDFREDVAEAMDMPPSYDQMSQAAGTNPAVVRQADDQEFIGSKMMNRMVQLDRQERELMANPEFAQERSQMKLSRARGLGPASQKYSWDNYYAPLEKLIQKYTTPDKQGLEEKWSAKYKKSINCSHPKGFSQKAHCAGKRKHNEDVSMEMTCPDCGMCRTHGDNMMEVKQRLDAHCWKGKHKEGTKIKGGIRVNNCVPNEGVAEGEGDEAYVACIVDFNRSGQAMVRRTKPLSKQQCEEIIANAKAKNPFVHPPFMTIYPASAGKLDGETIMKQFPDMSKQGVAEGDEYNEYSDEVDMVENNLLTIIRACKALAHTLKSGENLPEWVEEKISMSKQNMVSVSNYLQSQHAQGHVYDEDHSTATGGWGQAARPAIDVSSKLYGAGHDDRAMEATRQDLDSIYTSVGNQTTGGRPISFSQPTPAKTDTAKSWAWWWGAYIAANGIGMTRPPYTVSAQIKDYTLGKNAAGAQVGDFNTKKGMLQLNRPAGPMDTDGLMLRPEIIQRAKKLFPDRTAEPAPTSPIDSVGAVSVNNVRNMAVPYMSAKRESKDYLSSLQERLDAEVDERSKSQAQAQMMAAAAHNPAFAKKVGIKQNVAKEFNRADTGKDISKLPRRVVPKKRKK